MNNQSSNSSHFGLNHPNLLWIRLLDLLLSMSALAVLGPLFLGIALVLRFTGEHEVFFRQTRIGVNGSEFRVWKFASMLKGSDKMGPGLLTVRDDPRVLPFGRLLRSTKMNELPQLLNVVAGEMSLVGPRPLVPSTFHKFSKDEQLQITSLRPGLTGVGSVVFRDEEAIFSSIDGDREHYSDTVVSPYKLKLESWFAANQSIGLYIKLVFLTLTVVAMPQSRLIWKLLPDLPVPPSQLHAALNF